ncbi:intestinal mucin-like protein [Protopterus annectens]|uniref:intestinal mucin-like protein n=1 Tax=Protopterus annectens TaxID=7888 RepID=UPI001CF930D9|nr:intestinal mucin-like protein [Protopterus annectens]
MVKLVFDIQYFQRLTVKTHLPSVMYKRKSTPKPKNCELHSTINYISQNGCQSKVPVNVTSCQGSCGTYSMYSAEANKMEHTCSCCQEIKTHNETVVLVCPDGTTVNYSYIFVDKCECQGTSCDDLYSDNSFNKKTTKELEKRRRNVGVEAENTIFTEFVDEDEMFVFRAKGSASVVAMENVVEGRASREFYIKLCVVIS